MLVPAFDLRWQYVITNMAKRTVALHRARDGCEESATRPWIDRRRSNRQSVGLNQRCTLIATFPIAAEAADMRFYLGISDARLSPLSTTTPVMASHPAVLRALARVQSTTSLRRLLRDPLGFVVRDMRSIGVRPNTQPASTKQLLQDVDR